MNFQPDKSNGFLASLHNHHSGDPIDSWITDSPRQMVETAAKLGIKVLAFTLHGKYWQDNETKKYAKKFGILLISGIELAVEGKDVVVLGARLETEKIKTFAELRAYRKKMGKKIFILAPHPYHGPFTSLSGRLAANIDLFDGIEQSWFMHSFGWNKRAKRAAERYRLPLLATADAHAAGDLRHGCCFLREKVRNTDELFQALRRQRFENFTEKLSLFNYFSWMAKTNLAALRAKKTSPGCLAKTFFKIAFRGAPIYHLLKRRRFNFSSFFQ